MRGTRVRAATVICWVVLALTLGVASSHGEDDCLDAAAVLVVDQPVELTVNGVVWLQTETALANTYRVRVDAPAGSTLEVWALEFGWACYLPTKRVTVAEAAGDGISLDWPAPGDAAIALLPPAGQSVTMTVDLSLLAERPEGSAQIVPAAAHAPGAKNSFFQTDLWVYNPRPDIMDIVIEFIADDGGPWQRFELAMLPQQTVFYPDVVLTLFGLDGVTGAIRIEGPHRDWNWHPVVASRTYSVSPDGTRGQLIPATRWMDGASLVSNSSGFTDGPLRRVIHLAKSDAFRSNVGFVEVAGLDAELQITMLDPGSRVLGESAVELPAFGRRQINDIFGYLGVPPADNVQLIIEVLNGARVHSYGSVVDNFSSDPTYVPAIRAPNRHPAMTPSRMLVPAVACNPGTFGSQWQSDVRIAAVGEAGSVTLTLLRGPGAQPLEQVFEVVPGTLLVLEDVVAEFGASGSGALVIEPTTDIVVTSRTYNLTERGTYGQSIPPLWLSYVGRLQVGFIVGVEGSADRRANIGLVNYSSDFPTDVQVRLLDGSNQLLGQLTVALEASTHFQINDIFRHLGVQPQLNCRVEIEPLSPAGARVAAYASVIDNRSGDPVYIPAEERYLLR